MNFMRKMLIFAIIGIIFGSFSSDIAAMKRAWSGLGEIQDAKRLKKINPTNEQIEALRAERERKFEEIQRKQTEKEEEAFAALLSLMSFIDESSNAESSVSDEVSSSDESSSSSSVKRKRDDASDSDSDYKKSKVNPNELCEKIGGITVYDVLDTPQWQLQRRRFEELKKFKQYCAERNKMEEEK